jgi:hypothetical protein
MYAQVYKAIGTKHEATAVKAFNRYSRNIARNVLGKDKMNYKDTKRIGNIKLSRSSYTRSAYSGLSQG